MQIFSDLGHAGVRCLDSVLGVLHLCDLPRPRLCPHLPEKGEAADRFYSELGSRVDSGSREDKSRIQRIIGQ